MYRAVQLYPPITADRHVHELQVYTRHVTRPRIIRSKGNISGCRTNVHPLVIALPGDIHTTCGYIQGDILPGRDGAVT
ncbi:hypothetical protein QTA92_004433 [Salmonella enterica]|nr:hypothetical protein [Salmonella enterica]